MTRKMKDSGVEWIGEMNTSWKTMPLKFILKERRQKNLPIITKERLSLSIGIGVTLYAEKTTNLDRFKDDVTQYKVVYPNDLVINSMNVIVGAEGISNYLGCVSPAYYVMYSNNPQKFITKYYDYCFKTSTIQKVLFYLGKGIMAIDRGEGRVNTCRLKVSSYDLGRLEFPVPSIDEQHRIVEYLDNKCTKIDQTIEKEKQVIEKLKEYKQSIITEAVTKGLNPNASMKDSGVEWIGDIPEYWSVKTLKRAFSNRAGGAWGEEANGDENDRVCIRIADFDYSKLKIRTNIEFTKRNYNPDIITKLELKQGDILVEKSGGGETTPVGRTILYDLPIKALYANFMDRLRVYKDNYPKFIEYILVALYQQGITKQYIKQTTGIQNLDLTSMLSNEFIALPKLEEQKEIADYLDKKCSVINKLISNKENVIEKLTEYKKSLIYECVTGKREVQ